MEWEGTFFNEVDMRFDFLDDDNVTLESVREDLLLNDEISDAEWAFLEGYERERSSKI